jgi:hypothetical protein
MSRISAKYSHDDDDDEHDMVVEDDEEEERKIARPPKFQQISAIDASVKDLQYFILVIHFIY